MEWVPYRGIDPSACGAAPNNEKRLQGDSPKTEQKKVRAVGRGRGRGRSVIRGS
jgi:hypothetical protein